LQQSIESGVSKAIARRAWGGDTGTNQGR